MQTIRHQSLFLFFCSLFLATISLSEAHAERWRFRRGPMPRMFTPIVQQPYFYPQPTYRPQVPWTQSSFGQAQFQTPRPSQRSSQQPVYRRCPRCGRYHIVVPQGVQGLQPTSTTSQKSQSSFQSFSSPGNQGGKVHSSKPNPTPSTPTWRDVPDYGVGSATRIDETSESKNELVTKFADRSRRERTKTTTLTFEGGVEHITTQFSDSTSPPGGTGVYTYHKKETSHVLKLASGKEIDISDEFVANRFVSEKRVWVSSRGVVGKKNKKTGKTVPQLLVIKLDAGFTPNRREVQIVYRITETEVCPVAAVATRTTDTKLREAGYLKCTLESETQRWANAHRTVRDRQTEILNKKMSDLIDNPPACDSVNLEEIRKAAAELPESPPAPPITARELRESGSLRAACLNDPEFQARYPQFRNYHTPRQVIYQPTQVYHRHIHIRH